MKMRRSVVVCAKGREKASKLKRLCSVSARVEQRRQVKSMSVVVQDEDAR